MKHEKSCTQFEKINVNNSLQWVLIRGKNIDAPLLIHVQQGPGLPMISEADEMEKRLHLEDHFLVAYWDQRGCGKSFSKDTPRETMSLAQMADDLIACTKWLLDKFNKDKAVVTGYSIGATAALLAAHKNSSIFSRLFVTGIDVDIPYADQYALEFAMNKAIAANNSKLIKKITGLKRRPIVESKIFQQRTKILVNMGGINTTTTYNKMLWNTLKNLLCSKYYSIGEVLNTMKAMEFCQNALLPELSSLNLFTEVKKISVPVHFIQGSLDAIAPPARGRAFFEQLQSEGKTFTAFDKSAHMPQYEEPVKFSKLVISFLNQTK